MTKELSILEITYSKKDCALMGCKLDEDVPTLEWLIKNHSVMRVRAQAKMLVEDWGFSKDDKFCQECFWK